MGQDGSALIIMDLAGTRRWLWVQREFATPKSNDMHDCQVHDSGPPPGRLELPWRSPGWLTHRTAHKLFIRFLFRRSARLRADAPVLARVGEAKEGNHI